MDISPLFILLCVGGLTFAAQLFLRARKRRSRTSPERSKAAENLVAGLVSVNVAGMFGLGWLAMAILDQDGVMEVELAICAGLIAAMALITLVALAFKRRRRIRTALAMLAAVALPTIALCGFLLYIDNHPIDMR